MCIYGIYPPRYIIQVRTTRLQTRRLATPARTRGAAMGAALYHTRDTQVTLTAVSGAKTVFTKGFFALKLCPQLHLLE